MYTSILQYKVGSKGVHITQTCFPVWSNLNGVFTSLLSVNFES